MRVLLSVLAVALMSGCKAAEYVSTPPAEAQPNVWIQLNISGDAEAGPGTFSTTLDGFPWRDIVAGDNHVVAPVGNHTIALVVPTSGPASWCSSVGKGVYQNTFRGDAVSTITFGVNCPPLISEGTLQFNLNVSGTTPPAEMRLSLLRVNGPTVSRTVDVPTDKATSIILPVGLYRLSLSSSSYACSFAGALALANTTVAVRESAPATLNVAFRCNGAVS